MSSAGYLIARAAERPAILSLTTAIVAVRFFGLGRPLVRYLERLASHDFAFRLLARVRVRFYERIEPLAPAGLQEYRRGDLVSRMVGDVDALQSLYLRGLGPPVVAVGAGAVAIGVAAAILPAAAVRRALGLTGGGVGIPVVTWLVGHVSGPAERPRRASRDQLVELSAVRRARRLQALTRRSCVVFARTMRCWPGCPARFARSRARDGLGLLVLGAAAVAVLSVAVSAIQPETSIACSSRSYSRLRRSGHFPLLAAASCRRQSRRRVLELTDESLRSMTPGSTGHTTIAFENVTALRAGRACGARDFMVLEAGRKVADRPAAREDHHRVSSTLSRSVAGRVLFKP
jgi:ABC-type transport system involved in cytochrome bd biosynthesis fused ATPase/permease subunit